MSPRRADSDIAPAAQTALGRMAVEAGSALRAERLARGLRLGIVADKAGIATSTLHRLEAGEVSTLETYARVAVSLGTRPELLMRSGRPDRVASRRTDEDFVHAAMGELEARHFRGLGLPVAIDEPYQHYQFAGRADVVSWDLDKRALLHIENRTQFPNVQEAAGAFNAKRAYLPRVLFDRLGVRGGWASVTHAMVVVWSAECLHTLRLRRATFESLCSDPLDAFESWWAGSSPVAGDQATLVVLDPAPGVGRRRQFVGLDAIDRIDPRYRSYADVASRLRAVAR